MSSSVVPSFADCRQAAHLVRQAEYGREALKLVRPRGVSGLIRTRAPLSLLIYRAAREERLLWWSSSDFALLEPPADFARPTHAAPRWLRFLDRWWDLLLFFLPPAALLVVAVAVALSNPGRVNVLTALGFVLTAMLYVVVLMAATVVRGFLWLYRVLILGRPQELTELAVEQISASHWTVNLSHFGRPELARGMPRAARDRVAHLHRQTSAREASGDALCMERGIANLTARDVLKQLPGIYRLGPTVPVSVLTGDGPAELREPDPGPGKVPSGIPLLLLSMVIVIAVGARFVADWERAACRDGDCRERPVVYGDGLYWLLNRLSGGDPEGLGAVTLQARSVGLLVTLMSVVVVGWVITSLLQQSVARTRDAGRELVRSFNESASDSPRQVVADATADPTSSALAAVPRSVSGSQLVGVFAAGLTIGLFASWALRRTRTSQE